MDGQFSWKRTEDTEIDLADLLRKLCSRWKQIAVCALIFAVILGGYGWLKGRNDPNLAAAGTVQDAELSEAEEQGVAAALQLEKEIRGLEAYLDSSILMQLDPYHKNRVIMLYRIDRAERRELPVITESYLNFALNGGAAKTLTESADAQLADQSCLAELISAYQRTYSSPYQIVVNDEADRDQMAESVFYIEITGINAKEAKRMALKMQSVMKEYAVKVKETAGSHRLTLVSSMESVTADSGLQSQQHDKKALLTSNQTNLKSMTDAFSREQLAVYREASGEDEAEGQEELKETASGMSVSRAVKYLCLGLFGGVFIYCCIFSCWYVCSDKVKSTEEMKRLYKFVFCGGILLEDGMQKRTGTVFGKRQDNSMCTKMQTLNRVRLVCKKQGIKRLCAASDIPLEASERRCLEDMAAKLRECEIDMTVAENVREDTSVWDSLTKAGNVLMICRIGTTTHQMIDDVMEFYLVNDIPVAGAAAFLHNKKNRTCL